MKQVYIGKKLRIAIALIMCMACSISADAEKRVWADNEDVLLTIEDFGYYYEDGMKMVCSEICYLERTKDILLHFPVTLDCDYSNSMRILSFLYEDMDISSYDPNEYPRKDSYLCKYVTKGKPFSVFVLHPDTIDITDILKKIRIHNAQGQLKYSPQSFIMYKGSKIILVYKH